ncbi:alpha/beta hydrolase [Gordonia sp. (in: high G+C Gram-positive bacteria)]|uniref:alpha/beta fold hydrolase n=1 Tax=Gordonia sp. (in: high G+C Gram-positive bacteria) TaxID=84139 RepID=UPI0016A20D38|nr:alpha/beta hydrolase [Gordonia sp. (in: high G+C Gram-positive bacteria)]NLG45008.1 alpha/beta hydrolase [Gordonia sp. (in: high G+C Gram-positive bacteria)]
MPSRTGTAAVGDLEICFDEFGDPDDPAVLLIMGIGAQMVFWRTEFCEQIAAHGYRVIRFDNRDSGLSSKLDGVAPGGGPLLLNLARYWAGIPTAGTAYTLSDMADDAAGVLDHLGIERAHIVGASMGGMIAQVFCAEHADRALSATVIMSSNNRRFLPPPGPRQMLALLKRPPKNATRDDVIAQSMRLSRIIGSPVYPPEPAVARAHAAEYYDRSFYPVGFARQFAAIMGTGSLVAADRRIAAPTLVLHGSHDKLMRMSGAEAIAKTVRGAHLTVVDGMAHDLPRPLWDQIVGELTGHFADSDRA